MNDAKTKQIIGRGQLTVRSSVLTVGLIWKWVTNLNQQINLT